MLLVESYTAGTDYFNETFLGDSANIAADQEIRNVRPS
jgi:hypothetical protein